MDDYRISDDKASPAFHQASGISEEQRLRLAVEALQDPYVRGGYDEIRRRETATLDALYADQQRRAEQAIDAITQRMLDDRRDKPYLDYTPPAPSQADYQAVRHDATLRYEHDCTQELEDKKQQFLEEKQAFVARAQNHARFDERLRQREADREMGGRDLDQGREADDGHER